MEIFRIKSALYTKTSIIYGPFTMQFDKKGVAEVEIENDAQKAILDTVVSEYEQICYLDESQNIELEEKRKEDIQYLQKLLKSKEEDIKVLQLANEDLSGTVLQLQTTIKVMKEQKAENSTIEALPKESEKDSVVDEDASLKIELEKKTIAELKIILSDEKGVYPEEEWSKLTVKKDIINYILSKVS